MIIQGGAVVTQHPTPASPVALERDFAAHVARYEGHRRATVHREVVGPADFRLLWLLSDGEARTLKEISEALHLEQSTVNRQANAAIEHGIVERSRTGGRSAFVFRPTPRGEALLAESLAGLFAGYSSAFDRMGRDRAGELVQLLGEFVDAYVRDTDAHDAHEHPE